MEERFQNTLSIVVPCFNEELVIDETVKRLVELSNELKKHFSLYTELIFVNDGSNDGTLLRLLENLQKYPELRVINFARNFGHQIAVTAGMDASNGAAVVLLDADLQDPPPVIFDMVKLWKEEKYDVVYATRLERKGESIFKKMTAACFYKLLYKLSDTPIPLNTGDFRLMSRRVVDVMNTMPEKERFIRGMVSWVGFKQTSLPYKREERFAGHTHYPFHKMLALALNGITSFSIKPLKLASFLGFLCSILAFVGLIYALLLKLFTSNWITGWTSLMLAILFLGGVQLLCIGILGEYLGRIFVSSKDRPLYIVDKYYGYQNGHPRVSRSPIIDYEKLNDN